MKLTNEILREAVELDETIKRATKRLDEIKAIAKEQGSFATKDFVVAVTEVSRESLAGIQQVAAVYTRADLEKHGLIKQSTYQTVKILRKEGN